MNFTSYPGKRFFVISNEARVRRDDDVTQPAVYKAGEDIPEGFAAGQIKIIPKRTEVTVSDVRTDARKNVYVFANPADAAPGTPFGWTKADNLEGAFMNETCGLAPSRWALHPLGANKTVTDSQALVREGAPGFKSTGKTIPAGTFVSVLETSPDGRFVRVCAGTIEAEAFKRGDELGWTAASNLSDGCAEFYTSAAWQDQKGPNACWRLGRFIGQKVLINIVGTGAEMEQITLESLGPYMKLVGAAAEENVQIGIESGFRTFAHQKFLHDGWIAKKPNFNRAAEPGRSNHQHGQAFDLNTRDFGGPVYDWLKKHGPRLGFIRTVSGEHWHWEYMPEEAAALAKAGKFKLDTVDDTKKK